MRFSASLAAALLAAHLSPSARAEAPFSTEAERCIVPASALHGVNHFVLRAILKVESGLNPKALGRNGNGTVDVGIAQINSMHFPKLARHGVTPEHLRDACIGTYVAAWHLRQAIARHGNTWFGIATYHSSTPYYNARYQALLNNELVRSGALQGPLLSVPPLHHSH